jgi:mono/diheme cytochrome c family protein
MMSACAASPLLLLLGLFAPAIPSVMAQGTGAAPASLPPDQGNVGRPDPVNRFTATDGETLYRSICQGCHMADAKGAHGAGMFPALAGNPKLISAVYPAYVVVNGLHGMPSFAADLDDAQIAAVVNYVVTHFGNHAKSLVTAASVKAIRP